MPLICVKCDKEIKPGAEVDFVYAGDEDEPRIVTTDDTIVIHKTCPKQDA